MNKMNVIILALLLLSTCFSFLAYNRIQTLENNLATIHEKKTNEEGKVNQPEDPAVLAALLDSLNTSMRHQTETLNKLDKKLDKLGKPNVINQASSTNIVNTFGGEYDYTDDDGGFSFNLKNNQPFIDLQTVNSSRGNTCSFEGVCKMTAENTLLCGNIDNGIDHRFQIIFSQNGAEIEALPNANVSYYCGLGTGFTGKYTKKTQN